MRIAPLWRTIFWPGWSRAARTQPKQTNSRVYSPIWSNSSGQQRHSPSPNTLSSTNSCSCLGKSSAGTDSTKHWLSSGKKGGRCCSHPILTIWPSSCSRCSRTLSTGWCSGCRSCSCPKLKNYTNASNRWRATAISSSAWCGYFTMCAHLIKYGLRARTRRRK